MSALKLKIAATPTPTSVWTDIEAFFAQFPSLEGILTELEAAVGAVNINWGQVVSVIATAVQAGDTIEQIVIALLSNLATILTSPASAPKAAAALAKRAQAA